MGRNELFGLLPNGLCSGLPNVELELDDDHDAPTLGLGPIAVDGRGRGVLGVTATAVTVRAPRW